MSENNLSVDLEKIKLAIRSEIPLSVTTYTIPHEMELYLENVLREFLRILGQQHMAEYLVYCQKELMTNAKKANTKRAYFADKGLNINDESDYEKGMSSFKNETLDNLNYYLRLQKQAGYYIKFILQVKNKNIKIEVRNNAPLTVFEYRRIHDKLSRAQQYTSVGDAMAQVLDESEGAGLGLIIMILMLEKIGLSEGNFQTFCQNDETVSRLILPLSEQSFAAVNIISDEFEKSINELPQFPENIARLNRTLNDPDATLSDIAMQISNDIALTGELLRQVNSAAYALPESCSNITDAVKLLGIRGIRNMLYSIGTLASFSADCPEVALIWEHAHKSALYSYNLALNFCAKERTVVSDSYICGLLHDMGKIVFETYNSECTGRIKDICAAKEIGTEMMEYILSGANHAEIGARIAEKWHFPKNIIDVIRYHHCPDAAPEASQTLCSIVYLADLIVHYQLKEIDFYQIDAAALNRFGITSEEQFKIISDKLLFVFNEFQDKRPPSDERDKSAPAD